MKIIVSGGGTGGHIYPALSIIHYIKSVDPSSQFLYMGTKKGLEYEIVQREGIPFKSIEITGFKRKISLDNIKTILRFLKGTEKSKRIIRNFKPDIVIGTGGYVCGPVVYAAHKLGVPTIIHEQNSVPGLTNKFLSRYVDKIAVQFEEAKSYFPESKVEVVGNPRGSEVIGKDGKQGRISLGITSDEKVVLIVGGSRGARPINEAFLSIIQEAEKKPYTFVYVTGDVHYDNVVKEVEKIGNPKNVVIRPFIHNMQEVLNGIDLIVARAGATTLSEITALGIPSILIPSPYVTNNHQEKNAQALVSHQAASMIVEKELTGHSLLNAIDHVLLDEEKWKMMHEAAKQLGKQDAAKHMYELMVKTTGNLQL